jgi:hypothetical protein
MDDFKATAFKLHSAVAWGNVMKAVRSLGRFLAALIVASIVGELVAVPAAFFIDIVVGGNVTGGR